MRHRHLILFARPPRLGRVKRRLAAEIGDLAALRFYRMTLGRTVRVLGRDPRWRCWLFVDAGPMRPPRHLRRRPQARGDLGRRMERALRALPPGPRVLVGSDIPDIEQHHVRDAFRALGRADAVFGPAEDGGFWLVGLRHARAAPGLFDGVRWSGPHALADTLASLDERCRYATIARLRDVDDGADYRAWRKATGA